MQIQIIAVGKLKEKYLKDGIDEYLKRLQSYAKVDIVEVADEKEPANASAADEALIKAREAQRIQKQIVAQTAGRPQPFAADLFLLRRLVETKPRFVVAFHFARKDGINDFPRISRFHRERLLV